MRRILLILLLSPVLGFGKEPKPCLSPAEATRYLNKDICISVHVYDVVQLADGARFLDVCSPDLPDEACRFTIVSRSQDWNEVGELNHFRDADVQVRGIVESMHGRAGMVLSHARQFNGGPPKFRPNPKLVTGFTGDAERPPVGDPNLRPHGGHRGFMNSDEREQRPGK